MPYNRKRPPLDPCPLETVLALVSGKWKARVLYLLASNSLTFGELRSAIGGVRQQVLSKLLKELEADGAVARTPLGPQAGTRYGLTAMGRELVVQLVPLAEWGTVLLARRGIVWTQPMPAPFGDASRPSRRHVTSPVEGTRTRV